MHRTSRAAGIAFALCAGLGLTVWSQTPPLAVVSALPAGDLAEAIEARDVRLTFSEPMIAVGTRPTDAPAWFSIAPAAQGHFHWSGTSILIFTPDADSGFPQATRFAVTVGASAVALSGHRLPTPYTFSFVTPTVRLLSTAWYRKTGQFNSAAVVAVRFNQRVRADAALQHLHFALKPHEWTKPRLSSAERSRLETLDPEGARRFDAKVAAVDAVAQSAMPITMRLASRWDTNRLPPLNNQVVVETTSIVAPEAWIAAVLDDRMPSLEGPERHVEHSTIIKLEPAFFVDPFNCAADCDPAGWNPIRLRRPATPARVRGALTIADIGGPAGDSPIRPESETQACCAAQYFTPQVLGEPSEPPVATWRFRVDDSLQADDGQILGYPWLGIVSNGHHQPSLSLAGSVWESTGGMILPVVSRNVTAISEWMAPVAVNELMAAWRQVSDRARPGQMPPPVSMLTERLSIVPDRVQPHAIVPPTVTPTLKFGLLWAAVQEIVTLPGSVRRPPGSPIPPPRATVLQVTNLGITVKDGPQSTLVFVTRLDNAQPVGGARVSLIRTDNTVAWSGATDGDGIAIAPVPSIRSLERSWEFAFLVTAEKDGDVAFVGSDWSSVSNESPELVGGRQALKGAVFSDRGVYRAGDQVQIKAMLRSEAPNGLEVFAAGSPFDVQIFDDRQQEVSRQTLTVNRWSSIDWTWPIPSDAALGGYRVVITEPGLPKNAAYLRAHQAWGSFRVAAYRPPDFRVDAQVAASAAVRGVTIHASAEARYLFGAPLGPQPVRWRAWTYAVRTTPKAVAAAYPERDFTFGYYPTGNTSKELRTDSTKLDASGRVSTDIDTSGRADTPYEYSFETDVEGMSHQHIAGRASMEIYSSSVLVGLKRLKSFVDVSSGLSLEAIAADLDGLPAAGVPVEFSVVRNEWRQTSQQYPYMSWQPLEVPAGHAEAVSSADGRLRVHLEVPSGGSYVIHATARDRKGRRTRSDLAFFAIGRGAQWRDDGSRITLTPEQETWTAGDTARILVQSPWERATALLTIEREGVRAHRRFDIHSTADTIEVPLTAADAPGVFVSVTLIKGRTSDPRSPDEPDSGAPSSRIGYLHLDVRDPSRALAVKVSSDKTDYQPHEKAEVEVALHGPDGRAVSGEVTLWAVDYGLLSLSGYETPDVLHGMYTGRRLQVFTEDSRQRLIRRRATETASESTNHVQRSSQVMGLPLSALNITTDGIVVTAQTELVETSNTNVTTTVSADMMNSLSQVTKDALNLVAFLPRNGTTIDVRTDFRPVAFWIGSLETAADGTAKTTVTLPDSLTTYRIMAVAADAGSRFGSSEKEIATSKPLTMLPAFPRFLTRGDTATFGATVTNNRKSAADAVVTIRSLDDHALAFAGVTSRTVHLKPGGSAEVRFDGAALQAGWPHVRMTASIGDVHDAFEQPLAITVPASFETFAAYGDTVGTASEQLLAPDEALAGAGGLTVDLSSSALVGLGESARYLDEYPFECAEQKASRGLALLLSSDLGGAFELAGGKPDELRATAAHVLSDLYGYQCADGGFGLWPGGCQTSNAYLTAYVLHVFKHAASLNAPADADVIQRALGFLQTQLRQPSPDIRLLPAWGLSQAYAVKVLAEFNRPQALQAARLAGMAERLPVVALSYLADALAAGNDRGPVYQEVMRRVRNSLHVEGGRAHVEEVDDDALAWLWNTNTRSTAVVLEGLSRRKDDTPFAPGLVRWLLDARTKGRWGSTHENAAALEALAAYYRAFETDEPRFHAIVSLGTSPLGTADFAGRSSRSQQMQLPISDLLTRIAPSVASALTFVREGSGRLYYTARLRYLMPQPSDAIDRGIRVERRYDRVAANGVSGAGTGPIRVGELMRVTIAVTLPSEGRYLALTDRLPAGVEAIDAGLSVTASDIARVTTTQSADRGWMSWWRQGGFDHVEKHDDRVEAFATRLSAGRHEFTYLVRATTSGTFAAAGARVEEMYQPDVMGRSAAAVIRIR